MNQTTKRQHLAAAKRSNLRPDVDVVQPVHVLAMALREDARAAAVHLNTSRFQGFAGRG